MRIDQLLVQRGLASTRSQAQRLIADGVEWRQTASAWKRVAKNGDEVPEIAEVGCWTTPRHATCRAVASS